MKAISLYPRWAMEIALGRKTVECRTWRTSYRGSLVLCAGARREPGCISGHALAVCTLSSIQPFSQAHLLPAGMEEMPVRPSWAWTLEDVRLIRPIPVKGRLGLFDVDIQPVLLPDALSGAEFCSMFAPLFD